MARAGLLIGEVAEKSGVSRKALRLYEKAGIPLRPRRTASGYRVYGHENGLALLGFVSQARRLGFRLDEIINRSIVALKRSGRTPCSDVSDLVHMKLKNIERVPTDLAELLATRYELARQANSLYA